MFRRKVQSLHISEEGGQKWNRTRNDLNLGNHPDPSVSPGGRQGKNLRCGGCQRRLYVAPVDQLTYGAATPRKYCIYMSLATNFTGQVEAPVITSSPIVVQVVPVKNSYYRKATSNKKSR